MKTIQINDRLEKKLQSLLEMKPGATPEAIIEAALWLYMRESFLKLAAKQAAAIASNPVEYAEFKREYEMWDCTLMDGLEEFKDDKF